MTHFLLLVGSERDGFNHALAEAASTFLSEHGHTTSRYAYLARLPHYREELDASGVDDTVDDFRRAVYDSDAVLFVTPEYNGGPSSLIKNALDTASRPRESASIAGKPAAVVGATPSPGKTTGSRAALQEGLRRAGAEVLETSFGVGEAHQHLGEEGYAEEVLNGLHELLVELVGAVESEQAA